MINIKGIDKALVLQALFNRSKQQLMGFLDASGASQISVEQAADDIQSRWEACGLLYFDYHRGRVIKCDISGDEFRPALYDRDNGQGAAKAAIDGISVKAE